MLSPMVENFLEAIKAVIIKVNVGGLRMESNLFQCLQDCNEFRLKHCCRSSNLPQNRL